MESQNRTTSARYEPDVNRSSRVSWGIVLLGLTGMFVVSQPGYAVAAVIRIDQASAKAGDVTPGDAPGFPVTITRPGSYRLTSNLRSPSAVAIQIDADGVTLDLNGFAIIGTYVFEDSPGAISGNNRRHVRIHNGTIMGFSFPIRFEGDAQFITLEKLNINSTTFSNSIPVLSVAIFLGRNLPAYSTIRDVVADGQILLTCPSLVIDTIADGGTLVWALPYTGLAFSFPSNCRGTNVF